MSMRYYALYANAGWVLFDGCVDVGQDPKRIGIVDTQESATDVCAALNTADGLAKAAWDAEHRAKVGMQYAGVDFAAPGTKDRTTFSFDVETHAKRYFIGPGMDNALYGSATAIDSLRAKLNGRYARIQELAKVNAGLRWNLKSAQQAADGHIAECKKLMDERDQLEKRNKDMGNQIDGILRATVAGRNTYESIVDYIARLQAEVAGTVQATAINYWKDQFDIMSGRYEHLRKRISEL